ncbi:MAG: hypothetical protein AABX60_03700 [Nanoarchaeota archaeon]
MSINHPCKFVINLNLIRQILQKLRSNKIMKHVALIKLFSGEPVLFVIRMHVVEETAQGFNQQLIAQNRGLYVQAAQLILANADLNPKLRTIALRNDKEKCPVHQALGAYDLLQRAYYDFQARLDDKTDDKILN